MLYVSKKNLAKFLLPAQFCLHFINFFTMLYRFVCVFITTFFLNANGVGYRHVNVNKSRESSFYIAINLGIPLTNKVGNYDNLKLNVENINASSPISELLNESVFQDGSSVSPIHQLSGKATALNTKKFIADVSLGYKSAYLLRTDLSIDFFTASRVIPLGIKSSAWDALFGGRVPDNIEVASRQLAFLLNLYLDFDNRTIFTPYFGVGGGFSLNKLYLQTSWDGDGTGTTDRAPDLDMFSRIYFTYEIKGGFLIGNRKVFTDFQVFRRRTPKLTMDSIGFKIGAGFRV